MSDLEQLPDEISSIFDQGSWVDGIDLYSMRLFEEQLEGRLNDLQVNAEKAFVESEIEIFMQQRLIVQLLGTIKESWEILNQSQESKKDLAVVSTLDYLAGRAAETWSLYSQTRASGRARTALRKGKWATLYRDQAG